MSKCSKTIYYKNVLGTFLCKPVGKYQFTMACIKGFSYDCIPSSQLSYFSTKTYVVGTQKNHRNETVLLSSKL